MQNNLGQAAAQSILSADGLGLSMPAKSISATTYDQAMADARHRAGRTNPFFSLAQKIASGINLAKQHLTPPPAPVLIAQGPGVAKAYAADLPEEIRHAANQEISGEKMAEQIEPPSPPLDSDKLHLVAVIEDRALLRVNPKLVSEGNWPQHLLLGPGDKYDSISVLEISNDSVTLDEDGKKVVKTIAPIR
jgi:hypothetical protein